jgi:hypothetical protein
MESGAAWRTKNGGRGRMGKMGRANKFKPTDNVVELIEQTQRLVKNGFLDCFGKCGRKIWSMIDDGLITTWICKDCSRILNK